MNDMDLKNKTDLPWSNKGEFDGNDNVTFDAAYIKAPDDGIEVVYALRGGKDITDDNEKGPYSRLHTLLDAVGALLEDEGFWESDFTDDPQDRHSDKGAISTFLTMSLSGGYDRIHRDHDV